MYFQASQQFQNVISPRTRAADPATHAHSPRRRQASMLAIHARPNSSTGASPTLLSEFRASGLHNDDPFLPQRGPMPDPLTANLYKFRNPVSRKTTTSGDISMKDPSRPTSDSYDESMPDFTRPVSPASSRRTHPMRDYSRPQSLTSSRQVSWHPGEDLTAMKDPHFHDAEDIAVNEEQVSEDTFNDMVAQMSPREFSGNSGISAPSNTRVNSASNTPPAESSTTAEIRATPLIAGIPRSVSFTTRDPPPPTSRRVTSNHSVHSSADNFASTSRQLETREETGDESEDKSTQRPVGKPAGYVRSRKEGRTSEVSEEPSSKSQRRPSGRSTSALGKENSGRANGEKPGEAKRKRGTKVAAAKVNTKNRQDNIDSSPTKKISKLSPESSDGTMHLNDELEYVVSLPACPTLRPCPNS